MIYSSARKKLQRTIRNLHRSLEEAESALVEFEESLQGESILRPNEHKEHQFLSIPQLCQEVGMGKSWVYKRISSGELPSVRFGRSLKVKRQDLEKYIESHRHHPSAEE
jgi:excisionase family DNA binding protein